MRRVALIGIVFAGLLAGSLPGASASNPDALPRATTTATKKCSWQWKRKKVVKRVWRKGKVKRIVRHRKVRVRVCRNVPTPGPSRVGVKAWEFGFTLTAKRIKSGDTIFELNNQGEDAHDLHVQRVGGGEAFLTPETAPGAQSRIRFFTSPGSYRLWCSLPYHAERGMDTTVEAD